MPLERKRAVLICSKRSACFRPWCLSQRTLQLLEELVLLLGSLALPRGLGVEGGLIHAELVGEIGVREVPFGTARA